MGTGKCEPKKVKLSEVADSIEWPQPTWRQRLRWAIRVIKDISLLHYQVDDEGVKVEVRTARDYIKLNVSSRQDKSGMTRIKSSYASRQGKRPIRAETSISFKD